MLIDHENLLSYKQEITATANSANVVDLGPNHWAGASGSDREIPMFIHIDEPFTADGAATLTITLQSSDAENMTGAVTHWDSGAIALADLTSPRRWPENISLPSDVQRYVRATYTVATGPFTGGAITLGVTASRQTNF